MHKCSEFNQPEKPSCGKQDYRSHAPDHQPERRDFLVAASGLALAAGLASFAGCGPRAEPGLRIATNQWIGYELLYLSQSLGQLDHAGVRLVELLSNTDSVQALAAGTIDGAGLSPMPRSA